MENNKSFFDNLHTKPAPFIAIAYLVVVVSVVGLGLSLVKNQNALVINQVPPVIKDTLSVIPELPVAGPRVASAIDLATLTAPTPAMLEKGKQTFATVCATCHGAEGKGDGAAGVALNPKPRNFHTDEGWKNGKKVHELYKTLQLGIPGSGMPPYDYMSPEERIAVISYIRTFMTNAPVSSPQEIAQLDAAYKLSQGTQIPGTMPVTGAMAMKVADGKTSVGKVQAALQKLGQQNQSAPVQSFFAVCYAPEKALATLVNAPASLTGIEQFKQTVSAGLSRNGFSARVNLLSNEQLTEMVSVLKSALM